MSREQLEAIILEKYGEKPKRTDIKALALSCGLEMSARQGYDDMVSQLLEHINLDESENDKQEEQLPEVPATQIPDVPEPHPEAMPISEVVKRYGVSTSHLEHKRAHGVPYRGIFLI